MTKCLDLKQKKLLKHHGTIKKTVQLSFLYQYKQKCAYINHGVKGVYFHEYKVVRYNAFSFRPSYNK